jgi:hypothetical protein
MTENTNDRFDKGKKNINAQSKINGDQAFTVTFIGHEWIVLVFVFRHN